MSKAKVINDFKDWLQLVHDMSKENLPIKKQQSRMNEMLNELSEDAYIANFPKVVSIIQRSKEKCQRFKDTPEQVEDILSWLPRLKDHEELLYMLISDRRKNYHLPDVEPLPEKATDDEIRSQDKPQMGIAVKKPRFRSYNWNNQQLKKRSQICDWASLAMLVAIVLMMQFMASVPAFAVVIPLILAAGLQMYGFKIKARDKAIGGKGFTK